MRFRAFLIALVLGFFLSAVASAAPADVVVVALPPKGAVSVALTPAGKADMERGATLSWIRIEIDKLQTAQKLEPAMNAYVVWAISPEGGFENLGELQVADGKGRLEATTHFDQVGIIITAEPHFMVDRPNSVIAFRNQAPKSDNIRRLPVSVAVGTYDYSKLQPVTAAVPGLVAQARTAFQVASAVQAERYAESEFRLARIALGTMEEMLGRSTPPEIFLPMAVEAIRRAQRSFITARENTAAAVLESARNEATVLRRDAQTFQERIQSLTNERDAALTKVQGLDRDLADLRRKQDELQNAPAVKLAAEYFDAAAGTVTPAGSEALAKLAAAVGFWSAPVRISCPANAVEILKKFFADSAVPQNRFVIIANR